MRLAEYAERLSKQPAANVDLGGGYFSNRFQNAAKGSRAVGVRSAALLPSTEPCFVSGAVSEGQGNFLRGEVACENIIIIVHTRAHNLENAIDRPDCCAAKICVGRC